ncbi:hypothetical protein ACFE04_021859 [Oxalis oulophora]
MGIIWALDDHRVYSLTKKLLPFTFLLILPLSLFSLCYNPFLLHSLSLNRIKYSFPQDAKPRVYTQDLLQFPTQNHVSHQFPTKINSPQSLTGDQFQDTKPKFPTQDKVQGTTNRQIPTQDNVYTKEVPKQELIQGTQPRIPTQHTPPPYSIKDRHQDKTYQIPRQDQLQDNKLQDNEHKSLAGEQLQDTKSQSTKPQSTKPDMLQDTSTQSPKLDHGQDNVYQLPAQVQGQDAEPHSPTSQLQYTDSAVATKVENETQRRCDYSHGRWVYDKKGPLYNDKTCDTVIKEGQKCISHGRKDLHYLYWRWKPKACILPRFEPDTFLQLFTNKHVAFVGDSLARNQLESLVCMLGSASTPRLVYKDNEENKFRRWYFDSHNFTISIYWSPFLVHGIEKLNYSDHNQLHVDKIDERWGKDLEYMDMLVLSFGHWFLLHGVYFENDSAFGCHLCSDYDPIGFLIPLRKALKTIFKIISERIGVNGKELDVVLTTFSPSHFDGEWDNAGACPNTMPYKWDEKILEGMNKDLVNIEMEELNIAKEDAKRFKGLRLQLLEVTELSLMRADAHPGPYMTPFPFADGGQERIANDCVHWCLPGAIDAWNEILLELAKK